MCAVMSVHSFGNRKKFASGLLKPGNMGLDSVFMADGDMPTNCRHIL